MSSAAQIRRWPRVQVDMPVLIGFLNCAREQMIQGRAAEISEGGAAVYAGLNVIPGDLVQVEFKAPSHARLSAIICNRTGFCFGLEFLTPLTEDREATEQADVFPEKITGSREAGRGPLPAEDPAKRIRKPTAYVPTAQGVHAKAENEAGIKAAGTDLQTGETRLGQKASEMNRMRDQLAALRSVGAVLQQALAQQQANKEVDPRVITVIRAVNKLLRQPNP
jgi:PilZ domain